MREIPSGPAETVSEHQLIQMLAAGGRTVTAEQIGNWRKNGLLPPLTAHGLGAGKGKVHCWHEDGILLRGRIIYDAIQEHGRAEAAQISLFLAGFSVPMVRLRRALQQHGRRLTPLPGDEQTARLFDLAARRLGYDGAPRAWRLALTLAASLSPQSLVQTAQNADLHKARSLLKPLIKHLDRTADQARLPQLPQIAIPAIYLILLGMIRGGEEAQLEEIAARITDLDRPRLRPVQNLRALKDSRLQMQGR